jgi:hypothetical protein
MTTDTIDTRSDNERWYDDEIAPALAAIGEKLQARGMSIVCSVEYDPGERGDTLALAENASLAMRMVYLCTRTAPNVDSYMINLIRYCREKGIDTSESVAITYFGGRHHG